MSSFSYEMKKKDDLFTYPPPLSPLFSSPAPYYSRNYEEKSTPSSSFSRISPVLLWIIVTVAVIFFISALIHLLIRYLIKKSPSFSMIHHSNRFPDTTRSQSLQRQLQQLFSLHDSGLDEASIESLPVFEYKDMMGSREPFDCAVCLSEFSLQDQLRLLPMCGHAFHIDCIGTWLVSNSTCPLCRATLQGCSNLPMENPLIYFNEQHSRESSDRFHGVIMEESGEIEKRVFSVRLGKLRSSGNGEEEIEGEEAGPELDARARRCYSMGSYQYVVGESELQVALPEEGKRITVRSRGESLSVSKVWLWSKRSKVPGSLETPMWVPCNVSLSQLV